MNICQQLPDDSMCTCKLYNYYKITFYHILTYLILLFRFTNSQNVFSLLYCSQPLGIFNLLKKEILIIKWQHSFFCGIWISLCIMWELLKRLCLITLFLLIHLIMQCSNKINSAIWINIFAMMSHIALLVSVRETQFV